MSISIETNNLNKFLRVHKSLYNYSCGYYSQNCWVDNDRLVMSRNRNLPKDKFYGGTDLILVNILFHL